MADLTQTRPGSGATIVRALQGLRLRLAHTSRRAVLVEPEWSQLRTMPTPLLTPLQLEPTRQHMVTIERVGVNGVWVIDPIEGRHYIPADVFLKLYRGQVIAFE